MDTFVKQIPLSETIFGNIKKPPDIICVVVFLDCVNANVLIIILVSFYSQSISFISAWIRLVTEN